MHFKYINLKFRPNFVFGCSFVWQTDSIIFTFVYLGMNIVVHFILLYCIYLFTYLLLQRKKRHRVWKHMDKQTESPNLSNCFDLWLWTADVIWLSCAPLWLTSVRRRALTNIIFLKNGTLPLNDQMSVCPLC